MSRRLISTGSPFEREMAYSRAVVQGDWCFVSGITGFDYAAMTLPTDVGSQARNCFETLFGVLEEAEFGPGDLVRMQYTLTDRALLNNLQPVLFEFLDPVRPAATLVIADLMVSGMLFEVEATAFKG
ncbi:MAG: RidA family protein [Pseudomonadota bacterium]